MRYFCILALLAFAAGASADLLWDNGTPDARNGLSCVNWPEYPLDREIVDDFVVGDPGWYVYDGHFRLVTYYGGGAESVRGVKAFFYQDDGNNKPLLERYAERDCDFSAYLTGDYYFQRPEVAVDLKFDMVELGAGRWWVCFQPNMNDNSFWLTAPSKEESVWVSMPDLGYPKWTKGYNIWGEHYDMAFQITGEIIPEPGVVSLAGLLLGAGALWLRRK